MAVSLTPAQEAEVAFISGFNPDGTLAATAFATWTRAAGPPAYGPDSGQFKWGGSTAGTVGGSLTYSISPSFSAAQAATVLAGLNYWSEVANISFTAVAVGTPSDFVVTTNTSGVAQYTSGATPHPVGTTTVSAPTGSPAITLDLGATNADGSKKFGNFNNDYSDYGASFNTIVHEVGHLIGLGHGGPYNETGTGGGNLAPSMQFTAYDSRQYAAMSYINVPDTTSARYDPSIDTGNYTTNVTKTTALPNGFTQTVSGSASNLSSTGMVFDVLAAQRIYGAPTTGQLTQAQTFGFNTTLTGATKVLYDFTVVTDGANPNDPGQINRAAPVVTIWDSAATGNTLDLSGFATASVVHLAPGSYSSAGTLTSNIGIAYGTIISTVIGGTAADTFTGTSLGEVFTGKAGADTFTGGGGIDIYRDSAANLNGDTVNDFVLSDYIHVVDAVAPLVGLAYSGSVLSFAMATAVTTTYAINLLGGAPAGLTPNQRPDSSGGIDIYFGSGVPAVSAYSVAVAPAAVLEGSTGAGNQLAYTVTRTDGSAAATVDVAFSGTATAPGSAGADYAVTGLTAGKLAFAAGATTASFTVTTVPDTMAEANETVVVTISNATGGGTIASATAAATITDDDAATLDHTAPALTLAVIAGDDVLNGAEAQGALTVTGTAPGAEDGQVVTVAIRNAAGTTVFASTTATVTNGAWSLSFATGTGTQLPDRTYLVTANVSDRAGNAAPQAQRTLLVDKFADQPPSATLAVNATADGVVNAAEARAVAFTVAGLDGDATAVARFTDGTHAASASVAANGIFAIDLSGFSGPVTSSLAITDVHANTAAVTGNAVAFDTTAPVPSVSGVSGATNLVGHVVRGTIDPADAGSLVAIRDGADLLGTVASDAQGRWALPFTYEGPGNHTYHLTASGADAAGNTGVSADVDFALDFTPNQGLFGKVAHDATEPGGKIFELYEGLLGRAPDALGFENAVDAVEHGQSLASLARSLLASSEYTAAHGPISAETDAGFVSELYQVVLGRPADPAGTAFWTDALTHGTSRGDAALSFALSSENLGQDAAVLGAGVFVPDPIASDVARLYHGVLDRAPDGSGIQFWSNAVKGGLSETAVAQTFLSSGEYAAGHGAVPTAEAFITGLYDGALGRAPDAGGLAYWQNALDRGLSRADVAVGIAEGAEARTHHVGEIEQGWHLT